MNITSFREMSKDEQFQILAEILSQISTYRVVENSIDKKGPDVVFTYVIPDFEDDELVEFKRELDVMGFSTEIEEIDNELNLLVYPYRGIPGEAFEYLDEFTQEDMDDEEDHEDRTDPAGGTHYGNEEDPAHQYESLDDNKFLIDSLFEDDDKDDLKFPEDFSEDKKSDDLNDDVDVIDGEAIEKEPGDDNEDIDNLFSDNDNTIEDDINDNFEDNFKDEPLTGTEDNLIDNKLFGDENGNAQELTPEPEEDNVNVDVNIETDKEEAKMVKSQLINIKKSVEELLASIKPGQDMEPWVQAKLTLAQDYLQTVKNNLLDREEDMNEDFQRYKDPKEALFGNILEEELEDFDEDDYEKLKLSDIEDGLDENTLDIVKRVDHPMSGYQNAFNFCDYDIHLEKIGQEEYKVSITTQRGGGSIPKYLARQIENGSMDFPSVDDYDDLDPKMDKPVTEEETFSNLEEALNYIDEELDFE